MNPSQELKELIAEVEDLEVFFNEVNATEFHNALEVKEGHIGTHPCVWFGVKTFTQETNFSIFGARFIERYMKLEDEEQQHFARLLAKQKLLYRLVSNAQDLKEHAIKRFPSIKPFFEQKEVSHA